ncbi:sensor histidine kinase [Actinoplanes auranticolor]|uniref:histidine kinase n=1 Tax=Actinoplanes auranticolor TaxID=47988 RepID=A0A919SUL8_9ACTN|nr:sensor domain-containing protein [Actinoplanes auranticolor]GIM77348.1 histidine kinase [Actinoplanes auranticolor]
MNVWQALGSRRFLLSGWPWRAAGYLLGAALAGALTLLAGLLLLTAGVLVVLGPAAFALLGLPVARAERRVRRLLDDRPVPDAHRPPSRPGLRAWLTVRYTEPVTWRELGHALLLALLWPFDVLAVVLAVAVPLALLATPVLLGVDGGQVNVLKAWPVTSWPPAVAVAVLAVPVFALAAYGMTVYAGARAALARTLLTGPDARITELTRSRVRLVDAFEAERARIERDLHDGAQQRLVALTMMLGLARLDAPAGPLTTRLARAQDEAERALTELRQLIRGIHPPLLTDFGLPAAVAELADRSVIPVAVDLDLPGRFPAPIESTAWFVVCEAMANVARHSGAGRATIAGGYAAGTLTVRVRDDGRGGAGPDGGTGLVRLGDRVSVVDGRLTLSSPPGGPTVLTVELPCRPLPPCA